MKRKELKRQARIRGSRNQKFYEKIAQKYNSFGEYDFAGVSFTFFLGRRNFLPQKVGEKHGLLLFFHNMSVYQQFQRRYTTFSGSVSRILTVQKREAMLERIQQTIIRFYKESHSIEREQEKLLEERIRESLRREEWATGKLVGKLTQEKLEEVLRETETWFVQMAEHTEQSREIQREAREELYRRIEYMVSQGERDVSETERYTFLQESRERTERYTSFVGSVSRILAIQKREAVLEKIQQEIIRFYKESHSIEREQEKLLEERLRESLRREEWATGNLVRNLTQEKLEEVLRETETWFIQTAEHTEQSRENPEEYTDQIRKIQNETQAEVWTESQNEKQIERQSEEQLEELYRRIGHMVSQEERDVSETERYTLLQESRERTERYTSFVGSASRILAVQKREAVLEKIQQAIIRFYKESHSIEREQEELLEERLRESLRREEWVTGNLVGKLTREKLEEVLSEAETWLIRMTEHTEQSWKNLKEYTDQIQKIQDETQAELQNRKQTEVWTESQNEKQIERQSEEQLEELYRRIEHMVSQGERDVSETERYALLRESRDRTERYTGFEGSASRILVVQKREAVLEKIRQTITGVYKELFPIEREQERLLEERLREILRREEWVTGKHTSNLIQERAEEVLREAETWFIRMTEHTEQSREIQREARTESRGESQKEKRTDARTETQIEKQIEKQIERERRITELSEGFRTELYHRIEHILAQGEGDVSESDRYTLLQESRNRTERYTGFLGSVSRILAIQKREAVREKIRQTITSFYRELFPAAREQEQFLEEKLTREKLEEVLSEAEERFFQTESRTRQTIERQTETRLAYRTGKPLTELSPAHREELYRRIEYVLTENRESIYGTRRQERLLQRKLTGVLRERVNRSDVFRHIDREAAVRTQETQEIQKLMEPGLTAPRQQHRKAENPDSRENRFRQEQKAETVMLQKTTVSVKRTIEEQEGKIHSLQEEVRRQRQQIKEAIGRLEQRSEPRTVNVNQITDQVMREMQRQFRLEKARRGF